MQSDHPVLHRHTVDKGLLVIDEVGVGDPQLICHPVVQGEVERDARVGEALVPPRLLEVHGDGVVLQRQHRVRGQSVSKATLRSYSEHVTALCSGSQEFFHSPAHI